MNYSSYVTGMSLGVLALLAATNSSRAQSGHILLDDVVSCHSVADAKSLLSYRVKNPKGDLQNAVDAFNVKKGERSCVLLPDIMMQAEFTSVGIFSANDVAYEIKRIKVFNWSIMKKEDEGRGKKLPEDISGYIISKIPTGDSI